MTDFPNERIWHTVAQRWFTPEEKALFMAGYKRGFQAGANGNHFPDESWERYLRSNGYGVERGGLAGNEEIGYWGGGA